VMFPFTMKLTRRATGALQLDLGDRLDSGAGNNAAEIVLNVTPGEDDDLTGGGDGGGAGGGLPVTGGDVTGLILVAAVLLALGTGLFVASRRRV
jgi:LPXTG-motif cell wall-anchored protein